MPLDEEIRKALHEIRDLVAEKQLQTDMNTFELSRLKGLFEDHLKVCDANKNDMKEIKELMENVRASFKIANFLRSALLWISGIVGGVAVLWKTFKGN